MIDKFRPNWLTEGHFRMTAYSPLTGESRILVDKQNTIMYPATAIVARGLAGLANSSISHLYIGYNNDNTYPAGGYTISPSTTDFPRNTVTGLLRIPIVFPAAITPADDHSYQWVVFNVLVNQPVNCRVGVSPTLSSGSGGTGSYFFEAALVSQTDPTGSTSNIADDLVLSRVAFTRLAYNELFSLTVSWGIKLSI